MGSKILLPSNNNLKEFSQSLENLIERKRKDLLGFYARDLTNYPNWSEVPQLPEYKFINVPSRQLICKLRRDNLCEYGILDIDSFFKSYDKRTKKLEIQIYSGYEKPFVLLKKRRNI